MTKKILIADDELSVRFSLGIILRSLPNIQIDEAENGRDALKKLADQDYDMVFLDMFMPGLTGWAILDHLQLLSKKPRIVLVSAYATIPEVQRVAEIADAVLSKPFETKEILTLTKKFLGASDR
jgi:CheY-like chemotaxis protein